MKYIPCARFYGSIRKSTNVILTIDEVKPLYGLMNFRLEYDWTIALFPKGTIS